MTTKEIIDNFGSVIEAGVDGVKHIKGRTYGSLKMTPNSEIGYSVRKKDVIVEFRTEGKKNNLPSSELLEFVNKNKLLTQPIIDDLFLEVSIGQRNKLKLSINVKFPINSYDDVEDEIFINKIISTMLKLKDLFSPIATPKPIRKTSKPKNNATLVLWDDDNEELDYENHPESINGNNFELGDSVKGYYCKSCGQNESFSGDVVMYRYYKNNEDEDEFDFEEEILLPSQLSCSECDSEEIYCNYKDGYEFSINNEMNEGTPAYRAFSGQVHNFADHDGLYALFCSLGVNGKGAGNKSYEAASEEWNYIDEEDLYEIETESLVAIGASSYGEITQEDGSGNLFCEGEGNSCQTFDVS